MKTKTSLVKVKPPEALNKALLSAPGAIREFMFRDWILPRLPMGETGIGCESQPYTMNPSSRQKNIQSCFMVCFFYKGKHTKKTLPTQMGRQCNYKII